MAATVNSSHRRNKSTNVRSVGLRTVGTALRAIDRVSTEAAANVALALMSKQLRRIARPTWEREVLATADDHFHLPWRDGYLAGWAWGTGPIVLLVHGWEGRGSQMGRFIEPLVERGFRVVAFDGPGHGDSTVTRGSMPDHLAGLERVASHLGPIHGVVAHSMGGAATAIAAARGLGAERYVLIGPPTDPRDYFYAVQRHLGLSQAMIERLLELSEQAVGFRFAELHVPTRVAELDRPVLIFHDPEDREVEFRHGEAIAAAWPGATLRATAGLGHRRILKDPRVIEEAVEFLA